MTADTAEYVRRKIISAFEHVVLGDGIGLWQAQAIDDYESTEAQLQARERDEKTDWQSIPPEDIFYCESSLSFLDPEGMRFLMPAFILAELSGQTNVGPVFHLAQGSITFPDRFKLFDTRQKQAISCFLELCLTIEDYDWDAPHIKRALEEFWYKR